MSKQVTTYQPKVPQQRSAGQPVSYYSPEYAWMLPKEPQPVPSQPQPRPMNPQLVRFMKICVWVLFCWLAIAVLSAVIPGLFSVILFPLIATAGIFGPGKHIMIVFPVVMIGIPAALIWAVTNE